MNPIGLLSKLTEREREVLRLFCDGLAYKEIGEKLFIAVPTVKTHMGNIYVKLELDVLPRAKRKIALIEKFCPLLKKGELPPGPPDETDEPEPVPEPVMKVVEEDERAIVPWRPPRPPVIIIEPPREIEPLPRPRPRRLPWLLVGMVLGALLLVGIIYVVGRFLGTEEPPVVKYIEVTRGVMAEVTTTPAPPQPTPVPTVQTPEVTATREEVVVTATLQDTPTIAPPSPTPTPTPTPRPLPFEDNFDMGPRSDWEPVSGNWRMVDGKYTADASRAGSLTFVGDTGWTHYAVDVDVFHKSMAEHPIRIIVRAQDSSYMALETNCCSTDWFLVTGGSSHLVAHSDQGGLRGELDWAKNHIRIEVKGEIYVAYSDGVKLLEVQDPSFANGRIGLGFTNPHIDTPRFDNFRVTELR